MSKYLKSKPKVNVLGKTYRIFEGKPPSENIFGHVRYAEMEILIKEDMELTEKQYTVIHELTHAYLYATGIQEELKLKELEKWCQFIPLVIMNILDDNELTKFLKYRKREPKC